MSYKGGRQGMVLGLQPTSARSYISMHTDPGLSPHSEDWKHTHVSGGVNEVPWDVINI